ncbi:putative lipid II flippase FtsW [Clostridium akagii]|uniref:putative lipid II flippase FtsW n=1 Tax=Clostridium akagii TaxID=91623 RepID=UPI00047C7590|nr:putative lipid II flippase FtsW [Clostridium akagii]
MKKPKLFEKVEVDFVLLATVLLILAIGVVMVYSASSYVDLNDPKIHDDMYNFKKQGMFAVLGILILFFIEKVDYHKLKKVTNIIIVITICLLGVVFLFPAINGASRWIQVGPLSLQPSEIAKYAVVLLLARGIEKNGERIKKFFPTVFVYLLVAAFFAGFVYLEKNLSIATVIMVVSIIVIYVGGAKGWQLGAIISSLIPVGFIFILAEPYRLLRLKNFMNPWSAPKTTGYQAIQSLYALGSGGITGVGLGQSRQKCYYIPEPYNDFIFSIIGEELGFIGCVIIIILFLIVIQRGIKIAMHAKDVYGTLLAVGITSVIAIQAMINIAVVTGAIPVTGVPLPFISSGGSALVINLAAMGILLNISSQTTKK